MAPTDLDELARQRVASGARRQRRRLAIIAAAGAVGILAALAPATLTGRPAIDAVERAILGALTAYIGAHGHRRTWLLAGGVAALAARGPSLVLVLAALVLVLVGMTNRWRSKRLGVGVAGLLVLAVLWFPADGSPVLVHLVGFAVIAMLWWSGIPELRDRARWLVGGVVAAAAALTLVAIVAAAYGALAARTEVERGTQAARRALAAVERGDATTASDELATARARLLAARGTLAKPLVPGRLVPGLAQQVDAVEVAVEQSLSVADAAGELVDIDYQGLRYDGRLDLPTIEALAPRSAAVHDALDQAVTSIDDARDAPLLPPLRDRLDELSDQVIDARDSASVANSVVSQLPDLLGGHGTRRYLVVFLTPAELRGAGGFIGNYAEIVANGGEVRLIRSGRIADLIDAVPPGIRTLIAPEDYVRRWARFNPQDYIQDATFSPDWPMDAEVLRGLYPQSGGTVVDGVIGVDPTGLAALLRLTGPISLAGIGEPLTADNAAEVLTRTQYLEYGDRAERAEILEEATRRTFLKLTEGKLPAPRTLADSLGPAVRGRHLQIWSPRPDEEDLFALLGADGHLRVPAGDDGLMVSQINNGNNKIDAYLQRTITYRPTVDAKTGGLAATLTVELHNDLPGDPAALPTSVAGNTRGAPRGTSLSIISVMTPNLVTSATVDGLPMTLAQDTEAGLRTFETPVVQVPPGGTVVLTFELRGELDLSSGYRFRYLRQPVANPDQLTVDATVSNGELEAEDRWTNQATITDATDASVDVDLPLRR